ncbi:MAG: hypothetical protein R6V54_14600 [Desulfobacteraceae bacterium]
MHSVVEAMLSDRNTFQDITEDNLQYVTDLGLIRRKDFEMGHVRS